MHLPPSRALLCTASFVALTGLALIPHIGVMLLSFAHDWYGTVLPDTLTLAHYEEALGHELTLSCDRQQPQDTHRSPRCWTSCSASAWPMSWYAPRFRGRQLLDAMAMLPLAVPGIVMAFGYLALSREGQPLHALMLGEDPLLLLVVAYAMRRLPYVVRSASAGFQQVSPILEEAAQNLGASPERALWRITLPLVTPNLIAGALLAFSFAMLEVSDSMILAQQAAHFPITKAIYYAGLLIGRWPRAGRRAGRLGHGVPDHHDAGCRCGARQEAGRLVQGVISPFRGGWARRDGSFPGLRCAASAATTVTQARAPDYATLHPGYRWPRR